MCSLGYFLIKWTKLILCNKILYKRRYCKNPEYTVDGRLAHYTKGLVSQHQQNRISGMGRSWNAKPGIACDDLGRCPDTVPDWCKVNRSNQMCFNEQHIAVDCWMKELMNETNEQWWPTDTEAALFLTFSFLPLSFSLSLPSFTLSLSLSLSLCTHLSLCPSLSLFLSLPLPLCIHERNECIGYMEKNKGKFSPSLLSLRSQP